MADGDPHASIAPFQRYYLCIDGTEADDSVEYGKLLEDKFGFRNLLTEFLKPDPSGGAGDDRLLDPNHKFLPICRFTPRGRSKPVAIVCPTGRDSKGLDAFWQNFQGEGAEQPNARRDFVPPAMPDPITTFGRRTAIFKSALFMRDLILVPAIEKITDARGRSFAQITQGGIPGSRKPTDPDVPAELLIVSSHGWLGGFMHGDKPAPSPAAGPTDDERGTFIYPYYFIAGQAAADGRFFVGPKWIILAQCSTVNAATWLSWAKLMINGIPMVRGILAYEEVSPAVGGSIEIAREFIDRLGKGQTLLRAWRATNKTRNLKWSAIVHEKAIGDVMGRWDRFDVEAPVTEADLTPPPKPGDPPKPTTKAPQRYLAFGESLEHLKVADQPRDGKGLEFAAQMVLDEPPPFGLTVETADPNRTPPRPFEVITEATQGTRRQFMRAGMLVRTTITPPLNARIASATLRWIHMRESREPQVPITNIFQSFKADPDGSLQLTVSNKEPRVNRNTLDIQPTTGPVDRIVILWTLQTEAALERSGLEHAHSLVWPLVDIQVVGGKKASEKFGFSTQGLLR